MIGITKALGSGMTESYVTYPRKGEQDQVSCNENGMFPGNGSDECSQANNCTSSHVPSSSIEATLKSKICLRALLPFFK
jgi:hypothetical protein